MDLAQSAARVLHHALNTWGMDVSDVSRLAGHANVRVTLEMYVGSVVGALERARRATD